MNDMHAITDEAIRTAWEEEPSGDVFMSPDALEAAGWWGTLRHAVESTDPPEGFTDGLFYGFVASIRHRLGGWDAVWRAVLADEGFDDTEGLGREWHMIREPHPTLTVRRLSDGQYAISVLGYWILLRSPADLRVRVGHARGLFGEGTST